MIDDMNSDFAYLCNVHPNGTTHYDIDRICLFDINYILLDSFRVGTNKNSKKIPISHYITSEERRKFEKIKKRKN